MTPLEDTMLTFIDEYLKPYHVQALKTQITFEFEIINKIPDHTCTDWILYSEILFHLIQNAFKFTPKGGHIKLRISYQPLQLVQRNNRSREIDLNSNKRSIAEDRFSIYQEENSLGFLITEVEDNGQGIEKCKFQNLFQTFNMDDKS